MPFERMLIYCICSHVEGTGCTRLVRPRAPFDLYQIEEHSVQIWSSPPTFVVGFIFVCVFFLRCGHRCRRQKWRRQQMEIFPFWRQLLLPGGYTNYPFVLSTWFLFFIIDIVWEKERKWKQIVLLKANSGQCVIDDMRRNMNWSYNFFNVCYHSIFEIIHHPP